MCFIIKKDAHTNHNLQSMALRFRESQSSSIPSRTLPPRSFPFNQEVPPAPGHSYYVMAKKSQYVNQDLEKAIDLFRTAIYVGDRSDSALKDMAFALKQLDRDDEAIHAILSLRSLCSLESQDSLDNVLLDLYKKTGRLEEQTALLKHKLEYIQKRIAVTGQYTKMATSNGRRVRITCDEEVTRLLGNLAWALMLKNNFVEAETTYRQALEIGGHSNHLCNLSLCLMMLGRVAEAKATLQQARPRRVGDSHERAFERAQQILQYIETHKMDKRRNWDDQGHLFQVFLRLACNSEDHSSEMPPRLPSTMKPLKGFHDGNSDLRGTTNAAVVGLDRSMRPGGVRFGSSLNINAQPFYSSRTVREPNRIWYENSGHAYSSRSKTVSSSLGEGWGETSRKDSLERSDDKTQKDSSVREGHEWDQLLPDDEAFEEAIYGAVVCSSDVSKAD